MLNNLTERLIKNNVERYNSKLLIEAIQLGSNMSKLKRYSLMLNECDNISDDELQSFKDSLSSVDFRDDMSVDDRKSLLYDKLNNVQTVPMTITEENAETKLDEKIRKCRADYIDACKQNDQDSKNRLISQLKALERIKNR